MNKWLPALAIAGIVIFIGLFFLLRSPRQSEDQRSVATLGAIASNSPAPNLPPQARPEISPAGSNALKTPSPRTTEIPSAPLPSNAPPHPFLMGSADATPTLDPAVVLGNVRNIIARYGSQFGGNPVGTNPEITAALNGDNPKQAKFLAEDSGLRINGQGELVDNWGTPFFFHQISGTEMEIRSAGPDKKMWTADDLVTK